MVLPGKIMVKRIGMAWCIGEVQGSQEQKRQACVKYGTIPRVPTHHQRMERFNEPITFYYCGCGRGLFAAQVIPQPDFRGEAFGTC
jgi:hypothetical protein